MRKRDIKKGQMEGYGKKEKMDMKKRQEDKRDGKKDEI